ncbi:UNVERIFIED_CONTAM: hypothetical protein FKN15_020827 [Acipenser sinensis]
MDKFAFFEFGDMSVDIGETSWIDGDFDPADKRKEYLVRWRESHGKKVEVCAAKVLATSDDRQQHVMMREKAIWGENIGVSNEKMGKGQRRKITKNMDLSEEELEEQMRPKKTTVTNCALTSSKNILARYKNAQNNQSTNRMLRDFVGGATNPEVLGFITLRVVPDCIKGRRFETLQKEGVCES